MPEKTKQKPLETPIPTGVVKRLKNIRKTRPKLSLEQLQQEFVQARNLLTQKRFTGDIDSVAVNAVMNRHRKLKPFVSSRSSAKISNFVGFKVGSAGIRDRAEEMRSWADGVIRRLGKQKALAQNLITMINGEVVYLDTRDKVFGRENKNRGEPLDPDLKILSHDLFMMCKTAEDTNHRLARLQTSNNRLAVAWASLPSMRPVSFPAIEKERNPATLMLSGSMAEETRTVFKAINVDWKPYDIFAKFAENVVVPVGRIKRHFLSTMGDWNRWIITQGLVTDIRFNNNLPWRGTPATIADPEKGSDPKHQCNFYIPDHVDISVGALSEAYLIGFTKGRFVTTDEVDAEGNPIRILQEVSIDAWGLHGIEGRTVMDVEDIFGKREEEVIEGFIDIP
ncbi:MAG: hypothetical protein ACYTFW_00955 [Planctomycetota bacterium]|jgi:hypothetical protein